MSLHVARQLPENYRLIWRLDLRRRVGLLVWLNLLGILLLFLGGWLAPA